MTSFGWGDPLEKCLTTLDQPLAKSFAAKRGRWNCCVEIEAAAKADLLVDRAGEARHHVDMLRAKTKNESLCGLDPCYGENCQARPKILSFY
jgi:hypothetical protein